MLRERIKEMRDAQKLTQTQLASDAGISLNTVLNYEKNRRKPDAAVLKKIANSLHCTTDYLLGNVDDPKTFIPYKDPDYQLNEDGDYEPTAHKVIRDSVENLRDAFDVVMIPVLSPECTACCGAGIPTMDITSGNYGVISVARTDLGTIDAAHKPFAVIADGNSMSAWGISDGATVVVNPAEYIKNGDIVLACFHDKLMLKKIIEREDGSVDLLASDGSIIKVQKSDNNSDTFCVWGRAISATSKLRHGI